MEVKRINDKPFLGYAWQNRLFLGYASKINRVHGIQVFGRYVCMIGLLSNFGMFRNITHVLSYSYAKPFFFSALGQLLSSGRNRVQCSLEWANAHTWYNCVALFLI